MTRTAILATISFIGLGASGLCDFEPGHADLAHYPTFGVAFIVPAGWAEQMRDKGKTIAAWISPDSAPGKPNARIIVECGRTPDRSLDDVARGLARNLHGTVADRPTTLGGTRALRITANTDGRTLRPVEGVAAIHDGLLYLLMGGVTAGHSVAEELEAIRASWSWIPIEPPFNHLNFRDKPLSLLGGAATINVPSLMHVYPTEHPDSVLDLGLHNVLRNESDFLAFVQVAPMTEGRTLDELKNRLSAGLQAAHKIKGPLEWRTQGDQSQSVLSEAVEVETQEKPGEQKRMMLMRWALVKLDDRRLISVNFTLPPEATRGSSTYNALVDRIVKSIHPGVRTEQSNEKTGSGRREP
jgi:hypothetical protein